jgi:hypothetical protein
MPGGERSLGALVCPVSHQMYSHSRWTRGEGFWMRLTCLERVKMISPSRQYLLQVGPEGKLSGALPEMVNKTMTNRLLFLAETCFWWVYHESNPILILKPSELITNFIVYEVIWIQGRRY